MGTKESVYIIIDPFNAYAYELMRWAFLDRGLRAIVLIEDIHGAVYKKLYSPPIPDAWIAASYQCSLSQVKDLASDLRANYAVQGIIPWSETTLILAIELLRHLDINWLDPELLSRFRNKFILKDFLRLNHPEIRINKSWPVARANDVEALGAALPKKYVIKPLDGMSNQKIGFFDNQKPASAIDAYFATAGEGRFVLEEFINGQEYAVNGQTDESGIPHVFSILRYHHKHINGRPNVYTRSRHVSSSEPVFQILSAYAQRVVQALGLQRCPFHAEIRFDPQMGPCLVEIAARPVGNQLVQLIRDAHGQELDPLRIACHFYLSAEPLRGIPLNWPLYDKTQAINVDGITSKTGVIADLGLYLEIEQVPHFKRWVIKPEVGRTIAVTQDLLSQPFSFHLATIKPELDLLAEADRLEAFINIKTSDASFSQRLIAHVLSFFNRVRMRLALMHFKRSLRQVPRS